jgi:cobalt/nickel transport system ATP-binding protein
MTSPLLTCENLHLAYPGRPPLFTALSLTLAPGERVGLTGPNGSGKSSLFHLLTGFLHPASGRLGWFGHPVTIEKDFVAVRRRVGLLFQNPDDQLFCATVGDEVAFGPFNLGWPRPRVEAAVEHALTLVGLNGYADRVTYRLSEGEKRLVSLASILSMEPEVLLLDEPTNGLDAAAHARIAALLPSLPQAMLIASHDVAFLDQVTTRRIAL